MDGVEAEMNFSDNTHLDRFYHTETFAARFLLRGDERLRVVEEQWQIATKEIYETRGVSVEIDGMLQYWRA